MRNLGDISHRFARFGALYVIAQSIAFGSFTIRDSINKLLLFQSSMGVLVFFGLLFVFIGRWALWIKRREKKLFSAILPYRSLINNGLYTLAAIPFLVLCIALLGAGPIWFQQWSALLSGAFSLLFFVAVEFSWWAHVEEGSR